MSEHNLGALVASVRWSPLFPACHDVSNLEFVRSPSWVSQIFEGGIEKKLLPSAPASGLDLGCGNGYVVALMAAHGYDAYGIDLQRPLIKHAREAAEKLCFLPGRMSFACGNYLPADVRRRTKRQNHVLLDETPDPYEHLGKRPGDFDVFFIYPFPKQMDSVFDLFEHHAKKDARLLAFGNRMDWSLGREPGKCIAHLGTFYCGNECDKRTFSVYKKQ